MAVVLSPGQRDKALRALRDASKEMFGDPRRIEYADVDWLQILLAANNLQIAPLSAQLPAAKPPAAPAADTPAVKALSVLNTNELGWIKTLVAMYQQYKRENRNGYLLNMDQLGRLLTYTCRLAGITFKP